jgi:hypothetical protein
VFVSMLLHISTHDHTGLSHLLIRLMTKSGEVYSVDNEIKVL